MSPRIVPFPELTAAQRADCARILVDAFTHQPAAFSGPGEPDAEVASFFSDEDRAAWAAVEGETVVGWVGRVEAYDHAWELHPLAVDPTAQRRGIGAILVAALEDEARAAGMLTIYLGSDDDFGGTNLFGQELFPNVASRIATVAEASGHPFAFYAKQGYEIVGLIPHANGFGKPDIWMAKKL